MALSGSLNTSSYEGRYYQLSWTATQDASTNKSKISWTLKAVGGDASWYAERTVKVIIAGTTVYSKSDRVERYEGTVKTGTIEIAHNSDGTKSFSASVQAAVYVTSVNCTGSKTFTLNSIARKSTLSVSDGTLGTSQTLTINRNSDSFTHTITYTCGSVSATIAEKTTAIGVMFTPPTSLASQATSGTSVSIKYKLETFSGSTSLGSNSYTKTYSIPSSVAPTVSFTVEDAAGYFSTYGAYVQGRSKFKITVSASGKEGSTISSYKVTANGKTYTSSSVTTGVISSSGTLTISVTVTDSRGRTASTSKEVSVLAYSSPKITAISVQRSNASGTPTASGSYLCVKFSASVSSLNSKNTATYKVKYKKSSASSYTTATITNYSNKYSVSDGTYVFSADTNSSYDVVLILEDAFVSVDSTRSGSTMVKLFSWLSNGLGWAFGKVAELEDYLEVNFKALFYKDVEIRGNLNVTGIINSNGTNKLLWSGAYYMHGTQTIKLSEAVSKQTNGIVLVFSGYENGAPLDYRWHTFFIPKYMISVMYGTDYNFMLGTSNFGLLGCKNLTLNDTEIKGHVNNDTQSTGTSGVTYNNSAFVLRYVIGV